MNNFDPIKQTNWHGHIDKKASILTNLPFSQGMTAGQQNELRRLMIHAVLGTDM